MKQNPDALLIMYIYIYMYMWHIYLKRHLKSQALHQTARATLLLGPNLSTKQARAIGDALQLLGHNFPVNRPLASVMEDQPGCDARKM